MALPPPILLESSSQSFSTLQTACLKDLAESYTLTSIPSNYAYSSPEAVHLTDPVLSQEIPTIDLSLLTKGTPDQRSQIVRDLGQACREWGFFMVINHGVKESLRARMLDACQAFFDLSETEKREYAGKHVLDPIRCGTSFNPTVDKVLYWRDYLKVFMHPAFHSPDKPAGFREVSSEYIERIREVVKELLRGISESLGLEESYIEKASQLESGLQILIANFYPRCPQPELAMGIPPHSDHGLLTVLMQNDVGGLQLQHKGKWVNVDPLPNSFLVNTGDHLEILSNGNYKSVVHRAVVNNTAARISLAMAHGPSPDTAIAPAPTLVDSENHRPAYREMKYRDYLQLQQSNQLNGKSCLDNVRA
ncbi:2-oxoglutarate-dependent dioxygenase 19-like [Magnolia sinica]|uniref:2-oxoglutarate-dependent dioxygenase 19-like n=1 Tax=Magnolia sinica TaxID=86752 RepID=UPI002659F110|nr:2-oxoglutarate-dependent dioxygenase 19-like [Magnolia sinica]